MGSVLEQLEQQIADRLLANSFFDRIEVHVDPQKNIVAEVTRKISQCSYLVAPYVGAVGCANPDEEGARLDPIRISLGVFANPTFEASTAGLALATSARDIAEEIFSLRGLHHWKPDCLSTVLYPDTNLLENIPDKALNIYTVNFIAQGALTRVLSQVATPVYDAGAGTITSATPGAAVFYTTDGSYPGTSKALAQGNLGLAGGLTVRARAWLAGWLTSTLLTFTT